VSIDELNPSDLHYFRRLRLNPHFYLGEGDVRLTLDMQEALTAELFRLQRKVADHEAQMEELEFTLKEGRQAKELLQKIANLVAEVDL
jgi:hypothetical protein